MERRQSMGILSALLALSASASIGNTVLYRRPVQTPLPAVPGIEPRRSRRSYPRHNAPLGPSLAERIRTATNLDHLLALSDTAKSYRGASMATKRKWHKLAMQRREELVQAAVED